MALSNFIIASLLLASACSFSIRPVAIKKYSSHKISHSRRSSIAASDESDAKHDEKEYSSEEGSEVSRRNVIAGLSALILGKALVPEPVAADESIGYSSVKNGVKYSSLQARPSATYKGLAATAAVAWASTSEVYQPKPTVLVTPAHTIQSVAAAAHPLVRTIPIKVRARKYLQKFKRATRAFFRAAQIVALFLPAATMYPFVAAKKRNGGAKGKRLYTRWLNFCVHQAERGGAVVIKLCQWASSRPDIFGTDFCDTAKRLQDSTTPHRWAYTEQALLRAYGENWQDHLQIDQSDILGSGCMAQVYKGTITDDGGNLQPVAIKVIHPKVAKVIKSDLQILRYIARALERLPFGYGEKLKWNDLSGMVEEFSALLKPQLDLRNEAAHLERFNENFKNNPDVVFPRVVPGYNAHNDVLVETFCTGVPVAQFCREHAHDEELRTKLCDLAAHTMCTMIFEHNYVHGDLHPGNILISPDNKLVLLDCGIVNEYDESTHDLVVNIIASFIRMDGRRAAELMVDDSNRRLEGSGESAREVEAYVSEIENISKTARKGDFFFEKVTTYVNHIFNSASKHHVKMNRSFVSMALAVKVQEGAALMLDPKANIIHIANPIIMRAETKKLKQGNFDRIWQIAEDTWRDFKVRRERERNARLAAQNA